MAKVSKNLKQVWIRTPTKEEERSIALLTPDEKTAALLVGVAIKVRTLREEQVKSVQLIWNSLEGAYTAPISETATMYVDGDVYMECLQDALQATYGDRAKDSANISDQEYWAVATRLLDVSVWSADMDGVTIRENVR